eukprot:2954187-Rhodomonas_salina.2
MDAAIRAIRALSTTHRTPSAFRQLVNSPSTTLLFCPPESVYIGRITTSPVSLIRPGTAI